MIRDPNKLWALYLNLFLLSGLVTPKFTKLSLAYTTGYYQS